MEVQQHQELEMAEVASKVYDIIHPTPVSLEQLSAIVVSLEIWRSKVNEYRTDETLTKFDPCSLRKENTWVKIMLPDLPSTIYKTIEEVLSKFGHSIKFWRIEHYKRGFRFQYGHENHVLEDFDDFVCDYDGSIHYARTAERMMRCDRFYSEMKFIVACMYFFEDDIRRIWPSVSGNMNVDFIDFDKCPQLYYWICRLTNELDKIPTWERITVDERMFEESMPHNRPSVEYFWNRIRVPFKDLFFYAVDDLSSYDVVRFIFPKLNDEQLDIFVNDGYGYVDSLYSAILHLHCDEWIVLRTWFHVRNIIKESIFINLIIRMFHVGYGNTDEYQQYHVHEKWEFLCCQIWNHTQLNLKQSVIRVFSSESDHSFIEALPILYSYYEYDKVNIELLLTILKDASLKERHSFWRNRWSDLIGLVQSKNLQRVMEFIFANEDDEINQFKQNVIINSEVVLRRCISLFTKECFDLLNSFVRFCCPEVMAAIPARNFREQILQSVFLGERCILTSEIVCEIERMNELVKDMSIDFKNRLISSPLFMESLSSIICAGFTHSESIIKFIDITLVSMEDTVMQVKMSLIDSLKEFLTNNARYRDETFRKDVFNSVLLWCLGSNEGVEEFKLNQIKSNQIVYFCNGQLCCTL